MNKNSATWLHRAPVLLLAPLLTSTLPATAQFLEISAKIEVTSYRSGQTNAEANAKTTSISVVCITGTNRWRIENDWPPNSVNHWFFDGTNVYQSVRITKPPSQEFLDKINRGVGIAVAPFDTARSNLTIRIWPSPDGNPLGEVGVNIP